MAPPGDTVLFQAVCTPPRSFTRRGFGVLAGVLAALGGVQATLCWMAGAWPILPFLGIEIGFALALVALHARGSARMVEIILLTPDRLVVTRTDARGRREEVVLDPYWARAVYRPDPGHSGLLRLESRGQAAEIGRQLAAEEKATLHAALTEAMARARQPAFDNPQLR